MQASDHLLPTAVQVLETCVECSEARNISVTPHPSISVKVCASRGRNKARFIIVVDDF